MKFIGMSKREVMKALEGRKVKAFYYHENSRQMPRMMSFSLDDKREGEKVCYYLWFDKATRRGVSE